MDDEERRAKAKLRVEDAKARVTQARAEWRIAEGALRALGPAKSGMKLDQKIKRESTRQSERASNYIRLALRKHRIERNSKKSLVQFRRDTIEEALVKFPKAIKTVVLENIRLNKGRQFGPDR